jgi:DNA-binding MarR family transcriptional regulator
MTARALTRWYNSILAPLRIEITEFSLLGSLAAGGASSITELADRLVFERTTLVRNLRRLADRGLIEATGNEGRAVQYMLTKEGKRLLRKALPLWRDAQAAIRKRLDADPLAVLNSLAYLRRATPDSNRPAGEVQDHARSV